jgi:hypothetical protein
MYCFKLPCKRWREQNKIGERRLDEVYTSKCGDGTRAGSRKEPKLLAAAAGVIKFCLGSCSSCRSDIGFLYLNFYLPQENYMNTIFIDKSINLPTCTLFVNIKKVTFTNNSCN